MSSSNSSFNRRLVALVVVSFAVFAAAVVLRLGIGATPYETTDSAGHAMGFNDPLSWEHYRIMVAHFHPGEFLKTEHAYSWLLLAMQGAGTWLLLAGARVSARITRWFFVMQAMLFPLGLLFCWLPPAMFFGVLTTVSDREGFIDIPYIAVVSQSTWVLASLTIVFLLHGPGLGLARVWRGLAEGVRAGGRRFVEVAR